MHKVNVPEQMYVQFLEPMAVNTSLLIKLANTETTKRGRGYTRVVDVTDAEWDELLGYAKQFSSTKGVDRKIALVACLCARALAKRMEKEEAKPAPIIAAAPIVVGDGTEDDMENQVEDETEETQSEIDYFNQDFNLNHG